MSEGFRLFPICVSILTAIFLVSGCVHYPVNKPLTTVDLNSGYRGKLMDTPGNSDELVLLLRITVSLVIASLMILSQNS